MYILNWYSTTAVVLIDKGVHDIHQQNTKIGISFFLNFQATRSRTVATWYDFDRISQVKRNTVGQAKRVQGHHRRRRNQWYQIEGADTGTEKLR